MKRLSKYAGEFFRTFYLAIIWYTVLEMVNPENMLLNLLISTVIWLNSTMTIIRITKLEEAITKLTKKDNEVLNP